MSWGPGTSGLAPFDWLTSVPGMAILRAPARFALLVMLAVAVLAAYGTAVLVRRWDKTGSALVAGLAAAFLGESFLVGFPAGRPPSSPIPQVYHHLTTLPPGAVLSLPTYRATPEAFLESDYLLYSTAHWRPIVNGFGRQEPPAHADNMTALAGFPSPEAIRRARELGVRYVILHVGRASGLQRAVSDAARTTDVELLRQFGDDYLYRVR